MAIGSIGGINVKVTADATGFHASMNRVAGKVAKTATKVRSSANDFAKWSAAGVAAASAVGIAMVKSNMRTIDSLAKTSDRLGITTEALVGLQMAAELSGAGASTLNMALQRMTRRVSEAAIGTGEAKDAIKELGLDAQRLARMSPDEQFQKIAGAMGNVSVQGDKVRLAMKLFDTEGVKLVNTLALGEEGLKKVTQEAVELGVAISRVDAAKIESANDAMFTAGQAIDGVVTAASVKLSPIMEQMAKDFSDSAKKANQFGDALDSAFNGAINVIGVFQDAMRGIEVVFLGLNVAATGMNKMFIEIFMEVSKAIEQYINLSIGKINDLISAMNELPFVTMPLIKGFTSDAAAMFKNMADGASSNFRAAVDTMHEAAMKKLPSQVLKEYVAEAERTSQAVADAVGASLGGGEDDESTMGLSEADKKAMADKLMLLTESLKTEQQIKAENFAADLELLKLAKANKLITEQEFNEKEKAIKLAHAKELSDIELSLEKSKQDAIQSMRVNTANLAIGLLDQFAGKSKVAAIAAIALSKGLALAQNTQSTLVAQMRALAELGPIAGPPVAASIGTYGAVNAGLIAATGLTQAASALGGRGSALTSSGGVPAVNTTGGGGGSGGGGQTFTIAGLSDEGKYSGSSIKGLFEQINTGIKDGFTFEMGS